MFNDFSEFWVFFIELVLIVLGGDVFSILELVYRFMRVIFGFFRFLFVI